MIKDHHPLTLEAKIRDIGEDLRQSFAPLVEQLGSSHPRPVDLTKKLGLDHSLAGRLLRALRASDPLVTIREIPTPQGLGLVIKAAEESALFEPGTLARAKHAAARLQELSSEFPTGRAGLNVAIAGWLPDTRRRGEQAMKQTMFRAACELLGYMCETTVMTWVVAPSATNPLTCDALWLHTKAHLRRLRIGPQIGVFGLMLHPGEPGSDEFPVSVRETLAGERETLDSRKYLLPEFSDPSDPPLRTYEQGPFSQSSFDPDTPDINTPVTLVHAEVRRNAHFRYRRGDQTGDGPTFFTRIPTRLLVTDLLLHKAVLADSQPRVLAHAISPAGLGGIDDRLIELDRLELSTPIEFMGLGADRARLPELPRYGPMVRDTIGRMRWAPDEFRVFRCRVQYPVPFVALAHRYDLPEAPPGGADPSPCR